MALSEYNKRAGMSVSRLEALSDGLFAIAMTLLLLEVHLPEPATIGNETELYTALGLLAPRILVYVMSFLTLGIFWIGQQSQLSHLEGADRDVTWAHLGFLFLVSTVPLTTRFLADFAHYRIAVLCYWVVILFMGVTLWLAWTHAVRAKLLISDLPDGFAGVYLRRIVIAQSLYALAAAVSLWSTTASIATFLAIQIGYAVAVERFLPRRFRKREAGG